MTSLHFLLEGRRLRAGAHLGEGHVGKLVHLQPGLLPGVVVELTLEDAGSCHGGDAHACGGGREVGKLRFSGSQSLQSGLSGPHSPPAWGRGRSGRGHQSLTFLLPSLDLQGPQPGPAPILCNMPPEPEPL